MAAEHTFGDVAARGATYQLDRVGTRLGRALLLLPLLCFAAAIPLLSATDPDYWWHWRTGQVIYETGTVPRIDDYSFTVTGQPWISHEWLTELLIFVLGRGVGYVGVAAFFGAVSALTLGCVYLACRQRGVQPLAATLLCAWALLMMQPSINARPQMLTMLLLAVFALLLTRHQAGAQRVLWALPPLMALWVNLHGGYLIGLVLLGLTLVGAAARQFPARRWAALRPLLIATILTTLASFVTPHGLDALRYPLTYLGRENASLQFVAEWKSPDFHQFLFFPFAASLLLLVTLGLAQRPLRPTELFWGLTVVFMALQSVRHIPLYAVIVTPLLAARLGRVDWSPVARRPRSRELVRFGLGVVAVILPLLFLSVAWGLSGNGGGARQFARTPSAVGYPSGATDYLREAAPPGLLFNEYRWGGYLIEELYPQRRVFIDGRADPFGDALVTRYRETVLARPGWRDTLDTWQIGLVLVERDGPLATALRDDPAWRELYVGDVERLFARR
ncbi:MAG TPA: hypothetical protein VIL85_27615 [Thermomicrobiales bacterium]|jgi:hypothetical protein